MPGTGEQPAGDGEALASLAQDLESGTGRRRRGTARRRGRILHEGVRHEHDLADVGPDRTHVRSETHEHPVAASDDTEAADRNLLGADGTPRGEPEAQARTEAPRSGTARPSARRNPEVDPARVVDPTVFLVMAVRSYLEGLDTHGQEDPRTLDRLARLRETLAVYDGDHED